MTALDDICDGVNPFNYPDSVTYSALLAAGDDTDTTMPTAEDVAEVLHEASSGDQWDGTVAAVLKLHDGRFMVWETFYGPTGNGFIEDAYGGDAEIMFASTYDAAIRWGLTDEGRNLLDIPHPVGPARHTEDDAPTP